MSIDRPPTPSPEADLPTLRSADGRVFPLLESRLRACVAGGLFEAELVQSYRNPFDEKLDVLYVFPMSGTAALRELWMEVGDRRVQAECRDRDEARRDFTEARGQGHRAGLLTQERDEVLTLELASIAPGESVRVGVRFADRAEEADGEYRLRVPLVCGEKYNPASVEDPERVNPVRFAHASDAPRLDVEVLLEGAGRAIRGVRSTMFALATEFEAPDRVRLRLARAAERGDRDFTLSYRLAGETSEARLFVEPDGEDRVFLLELLPPAVPPARGLPRDVLFVLDVSGSMAGIKIDAARKALQGILHTLDDADRFDLLWFNTSWGRFSPSGDPLPFSQGNLDAADRWLERLHANGGTEMLDPLLAATRGEIPPGRMRLVVFLTDGEVGNEREILAAVTPRLGEARLFTFGVDTAVNASFLRRLAALGRGCCELLSPYDDVEAAVARFGARFGAPLASGLTLEALDGALIEARALLPSPLPDLFQGRPVSLLGRVPGSGPLALRVRAATPEGISWEARSVETRAGLAALWARARVEALEDERLLGSGRPGTEEEARAIALRYGILSPYTALLVVDRGGVVLGEARHIQQPAPSPADWDLGVQACLPRAPLPSGPRVARSRAVPPAPVPMDSMREEMEVCCASPRREQAGPRVQALGARSAVKAPADDLGAWLRRQRADGSFGTPLETAILLLVLLLDGHTDRSGIRQRNVARAARFLLDRIDALGDAAAPARVAFEQLGRQTADTSWTAAATRFGALGVPRLDAAGLQALLPHGHPLLTLLHERAGRLSM